MRLPRPPFARSDEQEATLRGYRLDRLVARAGSSLAIYEGTEVSSGERVEIRAFPIPADGGLRREAKRAAKRRVATSDPRVLPGRAAFERDGHLYIVTDFSEAPTLATRLEEGPLAREMALRVFTETVRGVEALDRAGVPNSLVSPAGILVEEPDGSRVRLVDIGTALSLVDLVQPWAHPFARYFSPELGTGQHTGAPTTVYSLGCILFECLTGSPPYEGSWIDLSSSHSGHPIPALSERRPELGSAADSVIQQALASEPKDRFHSVADLLRAATGALEGVSTSGRELASAAEWQAADEIAAEADAEPEAEVAEQREAEAEAKRQAEEEAQREAEAQADAEREAEAQAQREAEAQAKRQAEEREAEAQAKQQAEEEAQREGEAQADAKREAEAQAQREAEAEAEAKRQADEKAEREAEAEAKRQSEEEARREAEAEAAAQRDAEARAQRAEEAEAEREAPAQVRRGATTVTKPAATSEEEGAAKASRGRRLAVLGLLLLGLLAVGSYLLGRSERPDAAAAEEATFGPVSLQLPASWERRPARGLPASVRLNGAVAGGPRASEEMGIFAGRATPAGSDFVPAGLRASPGESARPVHLGRYDVYRRGGLSAARSPQAIVAYSIPLRDGAAVVACHAPQPALRRFLESCERVASTLELRGVRAVPLSRVAAENRRTREILTQLRRRRTEDRRLLSAARTLAGQTRAARRLTAAYATAAADLERLADEPPSWTRQAQLAAAVRAVERNYRRLASPTTLRSSSRSEVARRDVERTEAALAGILRG